MLAKPLVLLSDSARVLEEHNPPCQADLHVALLPASPPI